MKKLLAAICPLIAVSAFALDIDETGAKVTFAGYKLQSKVAVPGSFPGTKFKFAKTSGSVSEILTNTTAQIDLNSLDTTKNPVRDKHIKEFLFDHFSTKESSGKIVSVNGDDTKGELKVAINFNNKEQEVPMTYEVKDGKIVATGTIMLESDFDAKDAFEKFRSEKIIVGLHAGKTWDEVMIGFEIPVK
ncbi:MAG: YceI family protein [Campylobacter sp.]